MKEDIEKNIQNLNSEFRYFKINIFFYILPYFGPPPPSGVTQTMFWDGSFISQVLQ